MTIRELIALLGQYPLIVAAILVLPPALAVACGALHGRDGGKTTPWKYIYSVLVYAVCVPGIFAAVLTAYALFFTRENLLDVSLVLYFGPIACMGATLGLMRRNVAFEDVPGFGRLSGLMVMIGLSFAVALAIDKTRIWIFFGGSIWFLLLLALVIFAIFKWASYMMFRRGDQPKERTF
jgi:hypothetical protein